MTIRLSVIHVRGSGKFVGQGDEDWMMTKYMIFG
jgi:hypothetical protein